MFALIVAWRQAAHRQAVHHCSAKSQNPPLLLRIRSLFFNFHPDQFSHHETTIPASLTSFLPSIRFIKVALYSPSCATQINSHMIIPQPFSFRNWVIHFNPGRCPIKPLHINHRNTYALARIATNINKDRERSRAAWQEFIAVKRFKPKQEQKLITDVPPGGRDWTARQFLGKTQKPR